MNDKIRKIIFQIESLKQELESVLNEQDLLYRVEGTRIEFEEKFKQTHQLLREGLFQWFKSSKPRNVLSAPIIYSMIVPMVVFDLAITLYQHACFRLYQIPRVNRGDYLVFDRHHLAYLNLMQKINCVYCSYGNGLLSYAREVSARTEQYWCPIKHARKIVDPHERYLYFTAFGDAEAFQSGKLAFREALRKGDIPIVDIDDVSDRNE